ncbi:MAG: phosphate signaling complex protein PhoU [Planctomycetes bacterium]|nr:phosphate signaling complex protein PhoU [Planctomycetota bacterium]
MAKHLLRDLEHIKREILSVGGLVEQAIHRATTAFVERRPELADEVVEGDNEIDDREVRVEEECLKALALHQPVAADLRFIITVLKVNNDLERMGDLAVNIAQRSRYLANSKPTSFASQFRTMVDNVRSMVRDSLDALVNVDLALARRIYQRDDEVDAAHSKMYGLLQEKMEADVSCIDDCISLLSVSRHLERIADLATNIAEDVEFMIEGEIIRHRAHPRP